MPKVNVTKKELWDRIRKKCIDCMGHEDYRNRIRECDSDETCPLWPVRPYKPKRYDGE